jgi:glucosyl-3-phosphoglycerate synthase
MSAKGARSGLAGRTYVGSAWTAAGLLAIKRAQGSTLSVVLPALDEERTVGAIASTLRRELVDEVPLIDELVVMDSGSSDRTGMVARRAGATVVAAEDVAPGYGVVPGKGDVLWKSLLATSGDLVLFVDADLEDVSSTFVTGMLGPLLTEPTVAYVKAFYDRPLVTDQIIAPSGGGRVTELVARPVLNLYWPELAGIIQPLSGEYGGRRELLESIPFTSGYGVEIGMLIDVVTGHGLQALAQVDLGRRIHRHQTDDALGRMAAQVLQTALRRVDPAWAGAAIECARLVQFRRGQRGFIPTEYDVTVTERPPAASVPTAVRRQARALLAASREVDRLSGERP